MAPTADQAKPSTFVRSPKSTAEVNNAWVVFEDEAGQSMTPPRARTWGRRGSTPVVRVRGRGSGRVSMAGMTCYKPGERSRLIYAIREYRGRKDEPKGFGWKDYRDLIMGRAGMESGRVPAEFTFRDPADADELCCGECGGCVEALLTVGANESGAGGGSWAALELQAMVEADPSVDVDVYEPTQIQIGRGYVLQFYYCLADPRHLPRTVMQ